MFVLTSLCVCACVCAWIDWCVHKICVCVCVCVFVCVCVCSVILRGRWDLERFAMEDYQTNQASQKQLFI